MLTVHHVNAVLVIAVRLVAAASRRSSRRRRGARAGVAHLLALAQTLVVAQVLFGLLLLADAQARGRQAPLRLRHVRAARGALAVALRARPTRAAACSGSAVATLLAAALGVRAYMTAT